MGRSAEPVEVPLEDYVCLALYAASRAVTGLYRDLLGALDLTYPQYLVMRLLWQRGAMPVKDIGDTLELDYGTLSPLLKRLEQSGLLRRVRRTDDERSVQIELTDSGKKLRRRAEDIPDKLMCTLGLDDQAAADLRGTLHQIIASLKEAPAIA
ncbi:MAG: MarR family transcriptional regulator [Gemmataceae bacterium]|nr:MarR family transcriptional regulator [Gemmataceae bacterium]